MLDILWLSMGCGGWWWIYFGYWWVVVDCDKYILAGDKWWWLVVDIFWLVVGSDGLRCIIVGDGEWW